MFERGGEHAELIVDRDAADVIAAEAEQECALFGGAVGLLGDVESEAGTHAAGTAFGIDHFASGGDGLHDADGGSVVDNAKKIFREAEPLTEPGESNLFKLG